MSEPKSVERLLSVGERVLSDSSAIFEDHDNRDEAEELMALCLGIERDALDLEHEPPKRVRERFLSLIARRAAGEPFPFLTGSIRFYGLDLKVRPGAFVPRPSSELTVDWALRHLRRKKAPVVVDVCTGAGPIALAIAHELPNAEVWGSDISEEGLAQGRMNAKALGVGNVRYVRGDLYGALPERLRASIDLITGHVPYVPPGEVVDLPEEVREFEPGYTLTDNSNDGLGLMRRTVAEAREWLAPRGWLLLEVAEDIAPKIEKLCLKAGFEEVGTVADDDRLSVVVEGRSPR